MSNWVWTDAEHALAFGVNRLHIFDFVLNKFTGAKCYDTCPPQEDETKPQRQEASSIMPEIG